MRLDIRQCDDSRDQQCHRRPSRNQPLKRFSACFYRFRGRALLLHAVLGLVTVLPLQARESDYSQPIDVRADKSEFDEKAGLQTLTGNVEITQGTLRITADSIAITLSDNALSTINGSGSPISFEQENDAGELMRGEASRIVYDARSGTLTLEGSARLSQPRQNLSSERITFDARTQKISAEGGPSKGRVSIQIQPPSTVD